MIKNVKRNTDEIEGIERNEITVNHFGCYCDKSVNIFTVVENIERQKF